MLENLKTKHGLCIAGVAFTVVAGVTFAVTACNSRYSALDGSGQRIKDGILADARKNFPGKPITAADECMAHHVAIHQSNMLFVDNNLRRRLVAQKLSEDQIVSKIELNHKYDGAYTVRVWERCHAAQKPPTYNEWYDSLGLGSK